MPSSIHPQATSGFHAAASYDLYRPSYPPSAVDDLLTEIGVKGIAGARILEIGAGTGKFTESLASRVEQYRIMAAEPHTQMRGVLAKKKLNNTTVVPDVGESLESVDDGWADAVIIAQAFQWFATITTLQELRRVLGPNNGGLGLIWNIDDFNAPINSPLSTPYEARLKAIIRSLPNSTNQYRELKWKGCFHSSRQQLFKDPLLERDLQYQVELSKEGIWERFATMTQVASLNGTEFQALKCRVLDALNGDDVPETAQQNIKFHGRTVWYWTFPMSSGEGMLEVAAV